ncbi:MAG: DNA-directed RNA polymerase subunit alpha [Bacteroidetes bacterium QS_8_64_10]|nr:MAG: DNA-directed RNA polymerase subunit alpha [Bacteroidetes bacterium QS_8_64_10]
MPEGVQMKDATETFGRFVIQPLERGFGVTIGNALRRVLLSSMRGVAITAIKIDGVQHEFSTVEGITEDVADIILNLKGVRLKSGEGADEEGAVALSLEGPGEWTASDIEEVSSDYEVLNPDHHIATLSENVEVNVELRIGTGRGYIDADENKDDDDPIGVIPIDSIFTPIKNVSYNITPEEALSQGANIMREHVNFFIKMDEEPEPTEEEKEVDAEVQRIRELLAQPVDELDLSVRSHNCLKAANIQDIGELVRREENEMLKFRNFGRKSLQELVAVLNDRGLSFGMDVEKYLEEQKRSV